MPFDYVRSNIWDIGMNGPWNEESSIKQVPDALRLELVGVTHIESDTRTPCPVPRNS
jgi:hypothetical protein